MSNQEMSQQQITIVGAGIAGLVLGRCLLQKGIQAVIWERDALKPRYNYGITLRSSAYRQLLPILELDENSFVRKVAVDGAIGGHGADPSSSDKKPSFRANRQKFEQTLREGLDIRWESKVKAIGPSNEGVTLEFESGETIVSKVVVGADGAHSQVRKAISPETEFNILPFAVFNGKRRLDPAKFEKDYASHMMDSTVLSLQSSTTLLQVSLNERTEEKASISYTYSRPAKESSDALFSPRRPTTAATDITPELFQELRQLPELEEPYRTVFNSEAMEEDRLLNWLMRSISVPEKDLNAAADQGIVLLGDAVHHCPILGSEGANEAMEDAVELAEYIASGKDIKEYYRTKHSEWTKSVQDGETRLREMHERSKSSL